MVHIVSFFASRFAKNETEMRVEMRVKMDTFRCRVVGNRTKESSACIPSMVLSSSFVKIVCGLYNEHDGDMN